MQKEEGQRKINDMEKEEEHKRIKKEVGAQKRLKVHKIENFFGFDFEICTFS